MKNFDNLKGSCGCRKVSYEIKDKPLITQACHCKDCKKSTGSSFVIHTMVLEDDFSVIGEVSSTELPTGSGKGYRAYFCVNCGVYIYCQYNKGDKYKTYGNSEVAGDKTDDSHSIP
mgnify:CR=1 FL=1